ncbi:MFS transporter [Tumebacillus flagellatus]|uniref:Major facilitator superfamily (MFS) profile domain-containing protein n=1 Tax=Tumebacillus flagellatus TaxID=1157490 RepID=A0A074LV49_9BACL|nr:MFS transporter [Tumebacillus flagellatus]KEO84829.1 hypothetical protein EL26_02120 [Tumebacillus flagellatus]
MLQEVQTTTSKSGLFSPLKSRNFAALWGGQTMSRFGDILMNFMLPLIVYDLTASTVEMGKMMMFLTLPQVILLPFTGLLVDRLHRVRLMIFTDVIRFALMALLVALSATGHLNMASLYLLAVISGAMSAIFNPAYSAVRAQVFTPDIRNAANSLTMSSSQVASLVGPSLSGLLLGVTTYSVALGINALTFAISLGTLLMLRVSAPAQKGGQSWSITSFAKDLAGGYQELRKHAWLWMTILAFCLFNIFTAGVLSVLLPWLVKQHLGWDGVSFGLVMSSGGVGALVTAAIWGRRQVWKRRGMLAYLWIAGQGVFLFAMAFVHWLPGLMLLAALEGAAGMVFGLIWEGSLQELVPEEAFGRVVSLDIFGSIALLPFGYLATGILADKFGGLNVIMVEGACVFVLALFMLTLKPIRKFD